MTASNITVAVLLAIAALTTAICCIALVLLDDVFDRMHFLAPVTAIAMPALLAAVAIQEGWGQANLKTVLILFALLLVNAVLTHATARAARVRDLGSWQPGPDEKIPGVYGQAHQGRQPH